MVSAKRIPAGGCSGHCREPAGQSFLGLGESSELGHLDGKAKKLRESQRSQNFVCKIIIDYERLHSKR